MFENLPIGRVMAGAVLLVGCLLSIHEYNLTSTAPGQMDWQRHIPSLLSSTQQVPWT
jgi:hypothetical protein